MAKRRKALWGARLQVSADQRCLPRSVLSLENFDMNSSSGISIACRVLLICRFDPFVFLFATIFSICFHFF